MSRAKRESDFTVGDRVRARRGVMDPDFPDIPIGGWVGTVMEVNQGSPPNCLVQWDQKTLEHIHPVYKNRCERDGLDYERMGLSEADLEAGKSHQALDIEQPTDIQTKPLDLTDVEDRVRAVFGLTSDDPLPEVCFDRMRAYQAYLAENLSFPFQAVWEWRNGPPNRTKQVIVTGWGDSDEDFRIDDTYGLIFEIRVERERGDAPLAELNVKQKSSNRTLVNDFRYWFWNEK